MSERGNEYGFNLVFLRRFWRLQQVFFPALMSVNSGLFLLLLLTSGLEQYLAYEVGIIAGQAHLSITLGNLHNLYPWFVSRYV